MKTKTTLISALSLAMLCASSYAETIYFYTKDNSGDWPFLTDTGWYVDESGQRITPDFDANMYDVVVDMAKLGPDYTAGINANWNINSLTIQKTGSGSINSIWWYNEKVEGSGDDKTLSIKGDFNAYAGVRNGDWKRFSLEAGNINVDMADPNDNNGKFEFVGMKQLTVGDIAQKTGDIIVKKVSDFMFKDVQTTSVVGHDIKIESATGYVDIIYHGDLAVGNDVSISNVSKYVSMEGIGNRSDYKGGLTVGNDLVFNNIANGVSVNRTGFLNIGRDLVVSDIRITGENGKNTSNIANFSDAGRSAQDGTVLGDGISVGRNATFSDIEGHLKFNNSSSVTIAGDLSVTNLVSADGKTKYDMDFAEIGAYEGTDKGLYIGGNLTVENVSYFNAHRTRSVYIGGDFTAGKIAWTNLRNIGIFNGEVVGGLEIAGNVNYSGDGISIEQNASTIFRKNVNITTLVADGAGLLNGAQVGKLEIGQNLTASGDVRFRDTSFVKIGGDLSIGGNGMFAQYFGADGNAVSADNVGVDVGGQIKLGNGKMGAWFYADAEDPDKYGKEMFVKADGITASDGSLYTTNENGSLTDAYSVTYILKGEKNASYTGGIYQYVSGAGGGSLVSADPADLDNMKLNIIKNGAGTQSLIVNGVGSMWRGTVTLNGGRLNLYMLESDYVKVDLVLNQGTVLDVAYEKQGPHNPDTDYMGYISAGKVEINGDTQIWFDVSSDPYYADYESDWIKADEVTGTGVATLMIDLDVNYFSAGQVLEDFEFRIFEIADNSYDWAQALVKIMYGGSDITYKFSKYLAYFKDGSVYVSLTGVVPEPASVAALFGAVAMGFVLLRRRRK